MKKDPWKPVRRGNRYCSPACGGGCTYEAYEEARRHCKLLLDIMRTSGWRMDVWENLGWHYALRHDKLDISISQSRPDGNDYFLCGPIHLVGNIGHMKNPNWLVNAMMKNMRNEMKRVHDGLLSLGYK